MTWSLRGRIDHTTRESLPDWLDPLINVVDGIEAEQVTSLVPQPGIGRHSAVLILFSPERELVLIERAHDSSTHSGQTAFPGGVLEPQDSGTVAAALREAEEETGLNPTGVVTFGELPDLWIPISNFVVSPILGYWQEPSPLSVMDPREVASVHRVSIDEFVNPANRIRVSHPSGYIGNAFNVSDLVVWGFTGGLISTLLDLTGWAQPWDQSRIRPLAEVVDLP